MLKLIITIEGLKKARAEDPDAEKNTLYFLPCSLEEALKEGLFTSDEVQALELTERLRWNSAGVRTELRWATLKRLLKYNFVEIPDWFDGAARAFECTPVAIRELFKGRLKIY